MLTGRLPYDTEGPEATALNAAAFRAMNLDKPPHLLSEVAPELADQRGLEGILALCLSLEPGRRPQSAGQLRTAIANATGRVQMQLQESMPGATASRWTERQAEVDAKVKSPSGTQSGPRAERTRPTEKIQAYREELEAPTAPGGMDYRSLFVGLFVGALVVLLVFVFSGR